MVDRTFTFSKSCIITVDYGIFGPSVECTDPQGNLK